MEIRTPPPPDAARTGSDAPPSGTRRSLPPPERIDDPVLLRAADEARVRRRLSPRETAVLRYLLAGYDNAELAPVLGIARRTAEAHVTALLAKCEARSRMHLVAKVLKERSCECSRST